MIWPAVNWLAVVAGAGLVFLFSAVWYGFLFSNAWLRALGIRREDMRDLDMPGWPAFLTAAVSYLVLGAAMAVLVGWLDLTMVHQGIALGALTWLGFNATAFARLLFFEDRPVSLIAIDGGCDLAGHLIMGTVLTMWPMTS